MRSLPRAAVHDVLAVAGIDEVVAVAAVEDVGLRWSCCSWGPSRPRARPCRRRRRASRCRGGRAARRCPRCPVRWWLPLSRTFHRMPVIFGQPLCETLPVPPPPGVWRPLPSPHCSPDLRGSQRSASSSWASASAGVSRRMAAARATVRRMSASLTAGAPAENPHWSKVQQRSIRRLVAIVRVAGLERAAATSSSTRPDRDVAEQLHPREPGPVGVVAVDRERRARVGRAAARCGRACRAWACRRSR